MTIFMKVDGIDGNVTASGYKNWISLNSIKFGTYRQTKMQPGNNYDRVHSLAYGTEIVITKQMDKSTPHLFTEATVGKVLPKIKIDLCHTSKCLSPYMQYLLNKVLVSSYQIIAINAPLTVATIERLSLNVTQLETRYTPYDESHQIGIPLSTEHALNSTLKIKIPLAPPGVSIDKNIADVLVRLYLLQDSSNIATNGIVQLTNKIYYGETLIANLIWFRNQVETGGPWDYKNQQDHYDMRYEAFGNFNYGATARALGLPREFILCMGGRVAYEVASKKGTLTAKDGNPGFYCLPYTGKISPYGDDQIDDMPNIIAGMDYFDKMYGYVGS